MPDSLRDDPGELEFELDEREIQAAADDPDSTGTLRSGGETPEDLSLEAASMAEEGADEFGRRFFELSLREFESESELDQEIDGLLTEMEREYFLGGLLNKAKSFVGKAASGLAKVGGKAISSLASSALKGGLLKPLAQAALSFVPGGSMALPALQALGFMGGGGGALPMAAPAMPAMGDLMGALQPVLSGIGGQMPAAFGAQLPWNNLAQLFQDSFSQLASRMEGEVSDPVRAIQLAGDSFKAALDRRPGGTRGSVAVRSPSGQRVVRVKPGDVIVLKIV